MSTSTLASLGAAVTPSAPKPPDSIEETGLTAGAIEHLLMRMLYFRGDATGRELASAIGLKFSIFEPILESLRHQQLVLVKRSLGMGNISAIFALSESGRGVARKYIDTTSYSGPAPVPIDQYTRWVRIQRAQPGHVTKDTLARTYRHMVVSKEVTSVVGRAVSAGTSFLIYGQPGNGKTYLAEALAHLDDSLIYVPYAIEYNGAITQIFDPVYHKPVADQEAESIFLTTTSHDQRWFKTRRPFIVSGGELSLDMLDLSFNNTSNLYEAPLQMKANNGIYLIDDFGRQRATPAQILNRWIIPMERRVDYLNLQSGGKLTVPFEVFLVFSTNLQPDQIGDEAFLRRIQYKLLVRSPSEQEFGEIFDRVCHLQNLPCTKDAIERFVEKYYRQTGKPFRRCHPRDVIAHAVDLIRFEGLPFKVNDEVLEAAFASCFAQQVE